ncbi:hypothetical protein UP09_23300 [Bradyrhizobium sp. LTSP885]|nr:hypothetical protein UP09_23300 [Bradyrhizobium sp. LTSP885]
MATVDAITIATIGMVTAGTIGIVTAGTAMTAGIIRGAMPTAMATAGTTGITGTSGNDWERGYGPFHFLGECKGESE